MALNKEMEKHSMWRWSTNMLENLKLYYEWDRTLPEIKKELKERTIK